MLGTQKFELLLARMEDQSADTANHAQQSESIDSHDAAGHAADEHGEGGRFNADLMLVTILLFLALLAVLTKLAWKPILEGLENREKSIADNIDAAKRANDEAQENLRRYEQKLSEVTDQATAIVAEAKKDAMTVKEQILAEANQAAQAQRDRVIAEIDAAKDAAVRQLAEKSAETAVGLAGSIVGRSLNKDDHKALIEESINGFVKRV
ncbi:MAG: F0F1 ATP synthase subunit B [Pirellulaceae bacterium]